MGVSPRAGGLAAALLAGLVSVCALEQGPDANGAASLQSALDDWTAVRGHQAVSASVIFANGRQWSGVAGRVSETEALAVDHLIQIASITKTMTAAIVLQLIDEGVLRLDDPIGRWLAPRANIPSEVTIRQLLNHTGGLANYTGTAALREAIAGSAASRVFMPDELLAYADPPIDAPGARTHYTNTSYLVLALIAERATGRSIVDLYRQRLWAPLDLHEIFMPGLEEPPGAVAPSRGVAGLINPLAQLSTLSVGHAAFGLLASARDVARWGHALFTGTVISHEMQVVMRELVPAAGNIPGETGAGLGIRGYEYHDRVQIGHSGGAIFGSSLLLHDLTTAITVVVIMNQGQGADHFVLAPHLLAIAAAQPHVAAHRR